MTEYTRGTVTERVKTARLTAGRRVLTTPDDESGYVKAATSKTGAVVRTVREVGAVTYTGHRRALRRYFVIFTDGVKAADLVPIQTWHALPVSS